ncbi:MAG: Hsp70 family protein [Kiritimatiellae bacterium]|nr:Hsp70 family protein [Kiritimatiellia bacterium]
MSEKVYGIDLGTTYSCIAGFDEHGKVAVFDNDQGEPTTPSVVWFDGQTATVGSPAKEQAPVHPDSVVSAIKRKMGTDEETMQSGKALRPEMVSALILKKLVKDAGIPCNDANKPKVIITCPAYFGDSERKATRSAGEMAGLDVLSLIDEPSAAAFAYGLEKESLDGKTVLVFDLGGGTFDSTIIRIGREIKVVATGGDSYLGGRDWDELIARYFIERFCEETGYNRALADKDDGFLAEMMSLAEKYKRQLSSATKVKVSFEQFGRRCSFEFTRDEFDAKTSGLLQNAILATRQTLEEAGQKEYGFSTAGMEILMVGGSTLMPQVGVALEREFGTKPKSFRPHEAVARGAAFFARQIYAEKTIKAHGGDPNDLFLGGDSDAKKRFGDLFLGGDQGSFIRIRPVTSKSFGIHYFDSEDDKVGYIINVIPKNTEVPFVPENGFGESHAGTMFYNQTAVKFEVWENEEMSVGRHLDLDICSKIGEMTLTGLPEKRPPGQKCTVFMEMNHEGLLHAWGIHDETRKRCDVTITTDRILSVEEARGSAKRIVDWFRVE